VKVCVAGLWHLGTVTAACLASRGHDVTGLDVDREVVDQLAAGKPPVFEPGLEDLVGAGLASGGLRVTTDAEAALSGAEVVWVTYDTPVGEDDRADVDWVVERTALLFPHLTDGALMLISSQLPVGTTRRLELAFDAVSGGRRVAFAYSPENLRLGTAIAVFTDPDRVVVGVRSESDREKVVALLGPFTGRIEWMSIESAEMTKHALNAFLATSITFINEIATLCEQVGADATQVERGLKSERRVGPRAYLTPGGAFAGGTLARDVMFLSQLGETHGVPTHLLSSVKSSNDAHREWVKRRLLERLGSIDGKTIGVWGLTYKPGTDTLRRSGSVELCRWLHAQGATVRAHDPAVTQLPADLAESIHAVATALGAAERASALVVATPWPDYRGVAPDDVAARMTRGLVLDVNRFLGDTFGTHPGIEYVSVGKAHP
jgi:UDPglucose 6-dehydrogenase